MHWRASWWQKRSVGETSEADREKWGWIVKDGGIEEYHGKNWSRTPVIEVCGESWMPNVNCQVTLLWWTRLNTVTLLHKCKHKMLLWLIQWTTHNYAGNANIEQYTHKNYSAAYLYINSHPINMIHSHRRNHMISLYLRNHIINVSWRRINLEVILKVNCSYNIHYGKKV